MKPFLPKMTLLVALLIQFQPVHSWGQQKIDPLKLQHCSSTMATLSLKAEEPNATMAQIAISRATVKSMGNQVYELFRAEHPILHRESNSFSTLLKYDQKLRNGVEYYRGADSVDKLKTSNSPDLLKEAQRTAEKIQYTLLEGNRSELVEQFGQGLPEFMLSLEVFVTKSLLRAQPSIAHTSWYRHLKQSPNKELSDMAEDFANFSKGAKGIEGARFLLSGSEKDNLFRGMEKVESELAAKQPTSDTYGMGEQYFANLRYRHTQIHEGPLTEEAVIFDRKFDNYMEALASDPNQVKAIAPGAFPEILPLALAEMSGAAKLLHAAYSMNQFNINDQRVLDFVNSLKDQHRADRLLELIILGPN